MIYFKWKYQTIWILVACMFLSLILSIFGLSFMTWGFAGSLLLGQTINLFTTEKRK